MKDQRGFLAAPALLDKVLAGINSLVLMMLMLLASVRRGLGKRKTDQWFIEIFRPGTQSRSGLPRRHPGRATHTADGKINGAIAC
jgi:hypothetical protein